MLLVARGVYARLTVLSGVTGTAYAEPPFDSTPHAERHPALGRWPARTLDSKTRCEVMLLGGNVRVTQLRAGHCHVALPGRAPPNLGATRLNHSRPHSVLTSDHWRALQTFTLLKPGLGAPLSKTPHCYSLWIGGSAVGAHQDH